MRSFAGIGRGRSWTMTFSALFWIGGCGGGGSSGSPPVKTPPSGLSYPAPPD